MVIIFNILLPTQVHQLQQGFVGGNRAGQNIVVDHQIVTGPIGHQHIAPGIENVAAGCLNTGQRGKGGDVVGTAAGGNDLHIIQLKTKKANDEAEQQQQCTHPGAGHSFHVSPPIFPMDRRMG